MIFLKLAVGNISSLDTDARDNMLFEIQQRAHLRNPRVNWENELHERLIISLDVEGDNLLVFADAIAEEIYEVTAAVLRGIDGVYVEVVAAEKR